jgi:hypothetical protein
MKLLSPLLLALTVSVSAVAEDGFVPMFNGRDLSGWVNANCAPETWGVKDGVITCTGKPTGALRTERQYENFIMEVEWRHLSSGGNSGIFIWGTPIAAPGVPFLRGIEVQVLDQGYADAFEKKNGKKSDWFTCHGDVFPIHGATMTPIGRSNGKRSFPSEERSKPSPEWNHYRIVANAGTIRLSVNGKEVSGGDECSYRKGYLALESEGAPVEFRNAKIKELPPTGATLDQTAPEAQGHRPLYNGVDLRGWKSATPDRWQPSDWRLVLKAGEPGQPLWTEAAFGDCEFMVDVKISGKSANDFVLLLRGQESAGTTISLGELMPLGDVGAQDGIKWGAWNRVRVTVKGRAATLAINDREIRHQELPADAPARGAIGLADISIGLELANLLVREL